MNYNQLDLKAVTQALESKTNAAVTVQADPENGITVTVTKPVNLQDREITITLPRFALGDNASTETLTQEEIIDDLFQNAAALFKQIREEAN